MDDKPRRPQFIGIHFGSGLFVGLFLLALGVVLLLDQQGIVSAHRLSSFFWPAVLVFFGLENLLCRSGRHTFIGAVMLILGAIMLIGNLGYIPIHIGFATIWPILLIAVGLMMVVRRFGGGGPWGIGSRSPYVWQGVSNKTVTTGEFDAPSFGYFAFMSGVKQRIITKNFRSGRVTAVWGGFELDLTQAEIDGDEAVIDITAFMGGGKIRIPNTWIVEMRGAPIMGGLVDERENVPTPDGRPAKRLIIRGIVLMGGVVIKN
jgi:predicted membrane protein